MKDLTCRKCTCLAALHVCLANALHAEPIRPAFDGIHGIRARVLGRACAGCHDESLSGPARRGAPLWLNWNNYGTAVQYAGRIIHSATVSRHMPPADSGFALLDAGQAAALLAWEDAGYAQTELVAPVGATFNPATWQLSLPGVGVGNTRYDVRLRLLSGASSVDGIAFEVLTIVRADGPDTVATYDTPTGGLQIPRLQVGNAGAETLAATLQLQSRDSMVFRLDTVRRHFEQQVSPG